MGRLRVLVAEDSRTVRARIVETLAADPGIEVIAEAEDGAQAIELCARLRPDAMTLDMMMPKVTGLEATEHIMAMCPTPILVVSASVNRGELFRTYDALSAGAVDVLEKPTGHEATGVWEARLLAAVRMVARIRVITHPRARLGSMGRRLVTPPPLIAPPTGPVRLLAIGASTGGPGAVAEILRALPPTWSLPVLLVVHIGRPFGGALADWLDRGATIGVGLARHGQALPRPGENMVLVAPPEQHMVLERERVWLTDAPPRHSCRPSVDVLFESVAHEVGPNAVGCLLTGMGRDGADGLLSIRRAGGRTIAQDEATSVVFGMPREAIALGAVERVLPVGEIGGALRALQPAGGPR
jgi:two-component system, chemotaxis family, protein-glutamate methylesterase/glutaminase